jgi:hypothetical protein
MSYCKKISVFTLEHNPANKIFLVEKSITNVKILFATQHCNLLKLQKFK